MIEKYEITPLFQEVRSRYAGSFCKENMIFFALVQELNIHSYGWSSVKIKILHMTSHIRSPGLYEALPVSLAGCLAPGTKMYSQIIRE